MKWQVSQPQGCSEKQLLFQGSVCWLTTIHLDLPELPEKIIIAAKPGAYKLRLVQSQDCHVAVVTLA